MTKKGKKILLTNVYMKNFSGSELDTITIANYLSDNGYDVTIFSLEFGFPLLSEFNDDIKIINYDSVDKLDKKYDLLWGHHFPLIDYLIFNLKIEFDYISYISLSSFELYEFVPVYYDKLSYVAALSNEARDALKEQGINVKNIDIFSNYSYKKYYDNAKKANDSLKKICIVSNHVADEVLDFVNIARENNIVVDIFGKGYRFVKVDDSLLKEYDLVISIGKTVNYALSLKIPVYLYDIHGGDGYVTSDNIAKSHYYNFSGRYSGIKLSGQELFNDIVNNYKNALDNLESNYDYAFNSFCFEKKIDEVLDKIFNGSKVNLNTLIEKYYDYSRSSQLFVREMGINGYLSMINNICFCQLYYDTGKDFNEKESEYIYYKKVNNGYKITFKVPKNTIRVRFDFVGFSKALVGDIYLNGKKLDLKKYNNVVNIFGKDITLNNDPGILLDDVLPGKNEIVIELEKKSSEEFVQEVFVNYNQIKEEFDCLKNKYNSVINSRSWKLIQKMKKMIKK